MREKFPIAICNPRLPTTLSNHAPFSDIHFSTKIIVLAVGLKEF